MHADQIKPGRSRCPINLTVELFGDRWSLIVIRDIMFRGRRHYRDLLRHSEEGIASNILTDRLRKLVAAGLLTRCKDPAHRQRALYSLTEPAIQLVPLLAAMGAWGCRHTPATPAPWVKRLEDGGASGREAFMGELRSRHLGVK